MSKQFNPSQTNIILIIVSLVVVFLVGQYYNPEPAKEEGVAKDE